MRSLVVRFASSVLIAAAAVGCGLVRSDPADAAADHGIEAPTFIELSATEGIGMRRAGAEIEVIRLVPEGAGWEELALATGPARDTVTVQFVASEPEASDPRTYLFGSAPPSATEVQVEVPPPEDGNEEVRVEGGTVAAGTWLVVIHAAVPDPSVIGWRVLDADGTIVDEGTGTTS